MSRLGQPLLVVVGGFVHLAHRVTRGIQLSIESWRSLAEACAAFPDAAVELEPDGLVLGPEEAELLLALHAGSDVASYRGQSRLARMGLVSVESRPRADKAIITDHGRRIAERIAPPHPLAGAEHG